MAKKKSAAQIRRLQERASSRGEEYIPPVVDIVVEEEKKKKERDVSKKDKWMKIVLELQTELARIENATDLPSKGRRSAKRKAEAIATEDAGIPLSELLEWYKKQSKKKNTDSTIDPETVKRSTAAKKLKKEIEDLETRVDLKAKDRRSAKRKAEAIALEESGLSSEELLKWYDEWLLKSQASTTTQNNQKGSNINKTTKHDPYVAFVGQLSFETTTDELYQHIHENLKDDFKFQRKDVKIRILTDANTKKSRGMAFVEVEDPEMLYGLLKLHQTFLNGRRINIERSAGGSKNSETRKEKLAQYRKEQDEYFADVVDKILQEYRDTGELRDDELDEGVVGLCKRHAGPVVRAAVAEYMEKGGRDMDNPSAYLTFLVTKFATEGIREDKEEERSNNKNTNNKVTTSKRKNLGSSSNFNKRPKRDSTTDSGGTSMFSKAGIDMSMSKQISGGAKEFNKIFPSARRGRGRGYM